MCKALARAGHKLLVLDNLSTGHRASIKEIDVVVADLLDADGVENVMKTWAPDIVFHFAALSVVRDSVADPIRYYQNNVTGTLNLLASMLRNRVEKFIFSSSASVYGLPQVDLIDETHPTAPINPYGATKLMVERVLNDLAKSNGLRSASLRYFNAAGADKDGEIGESHDPETHLIPNVLRAVNGNVTLDVYGMDYDTADGTCVRDYVHVTDLVDAHLRAACFLEKNDGSHIFNLGSSRGFSVLEVIEVASRIVGQPIDFRRCPRRQGDPAKLVAANALALGALGWRPCFSDLDNMVRSAWAWHQNRKY
jgi:UDP-glucose 4-epimerase